MLTFAPVLPVCHTCRWAHPCVLAIRDAVSEIAPRGYRERSGGDSVMVWVDGHLLPIRVGL